MQVFDVVLKLLLQQSKQILPQLAGVTIVDWLPTELPQVQNRRLDLLGWASNGALLHLECQSANDPQMALRMADRHRRSVRLVSVHACGCAYMDSAPLLASEETIDTNWQSNPVTAFPAPCRDL